MSTAAVVPIRRAVVIGQNYTGTNYALTGCVNDARALRDALLNSCGFSGADVRLLTDVKRKAILDAVAWLTAVPSGKPALLVFAYSGHGSYVPDRSADETDGADSALVATDTLLTDDDLQAAMTRTLPSTATLLTLLDCCHAGTAMDLKYGLVYDSNKKAYASNNQPRAPRLAGSPDARVVAFGGCRDPELSYELRVNGKAFGAFTTGLLEIIRRQTPMTHRQVLAALNARMVTLKLPKQRPELSASDPTLLDACCALTMPPATNVAMSPAARVTLYGKTNFEGRFLELTAVGRYDRAQLQGLGITPGSLSSLTIAPMTGVVLYTLPGFSGRALDLRGYMGQSRVIPDLRYYGFAPVTVSLVVYKL